MVVRSSSCPQRRRDQVAGESALGGERRRESSHRVRGDARNLGSVADALDLVDHPVPAVRLVRGPLVRPLALEQVPIARLAGGELREQWAQLGGHLERAAASGRENRGDAAEGTGGGQGTVPQNPGPRVVGRSGDTVKRRTLQSAISTPMRSRRWRVQTTDSPARRKQSAISSPI
jgi:hypothetical protein